MSDLVGRKLGKYTLEAQLGEGGMAAVFRSHHPQFNRPVAIKILPPTIGQDPSFRARFAREGQMIASLNHPHIIRVYDIDEADGLFYMVMDLLPGGTLEARLRDGRLDRRWSADVIVKMAEALEYAHMRGVIHRDIKPSNILLDAEGQPVLADFGIARLVQGEGEQNLTAAGTVMGTPAYMAPEQLTGGQPDTRSDIYSLGVVLYQLLTGRAPFIGDTMAVVTAHLTRQPPPLREIVSDLPAALDAVVLQALAKQPEHRFKSAGVFAQALRSAAADLEPGLVRIASAAPQPVAPAFGGVALPQAGSMASQPPMTAGQKVARYLPIALGALGLLLAISILARYWALVALLAILFGGGGFVFLYLRARAQGRKAASETTQAITTAAIRAAAPSVPDPRATLVLEDRDDVLNQPLAAPAVSVQPTPQQTIASGERDDVVELPLPDEPAQALDPAPVSADLPPTEAVPAAISEDQIATAAMPTPQPADLLPNEVVPASAPQPFADLPPTEVVPASAPESADLPPTEIVPVAGDLPPTEALPAAGRPLEEKRTE